MGMNFSPMYQPVSTKTIKADGDLNINPYDLLATDVKCDTVEASEFVGGVGNFSSIVMPTLSYSGYTTLTLSGYYYNASGYCNTYTIFSSPFPISGKVSIRTNNTANYFSTDLIILSTSGITSRNITTTQTEYTVTNAYSIAIGMKKSGAAESVSGTYTYTIGIPVLIP